MSQDPEPGEQDRDLMEGLLFDLGIYGEPMAPLPPALGGLAARVTLPSVSTELSFGDDPLRELTEKSCVHHLPSGEFISEHRLPVAFRRSSLAYFRYLYTSIFVRNNAETEKTCDVSRGGA